jgi:hypothetical protein
MRANGVRSLDVCVVLELPHWAIMSAPLWPDDVPVPTFGPRMVCTRCGIMGGARAAERQFAAMQRSASEMVQ